MPGTPETPPSSEQSATVKPTRLEVIDILGKALLAPILGTAIAYYGYTTSRATSREDVAEKYVSIAVDVLKGKRDDSNSEIFIWAAKTLNTYAAVPFSPEAIQQLEQGSLSGNPVAFGVSRHDIIGGHLGNAYLTINNTTSVPLTIKSIAIIGPNDLSPPCKMDVAITPAESVVAPLQQRSIRLLPIETIAHCLKTDVSVGSSYQFADISTSPTFDDFDKVTGHAYSQTGAGFGIAVEYESKSGTANTLFGGYLHYLEDNGQPLIISTR